jgi:hypothetical protein
MIDTRRQISTAVSNRGRSTITIVAVAGVSVLAATVLSGWWFSRETSQSDPAPSATGREYATSIIVSSPNADGCQRYKLDNATGRIEDSSTGDCRSESGGQGTRVEEISKAFRNR